MTIWQAAFLFGSYLLGAIPFGMAVARVAGVGDPRAQGSGNIGATNLLRVAGKKAGAVTLLLDGGKGALAVWLARQLPDPQGFLPAWAAAAAFLGHLYPVFLGFRGGKGVATGLGGILALAPVPGGLMILTWLATAGLFRRSSLASLAAFAVLPPAAFFLAPAPVLATSAVMTPLVFWKHRTNIGRLVAGLEPRIGDKPREPVSKG